jgi:hypothetical protein
MTFVFQTWPLLASVGGSSPKRCRFAAILLELLKPPVDDAEPHKFLPGRGKSEMSGHHSFVTCDQKTVIAPFSISWRGRVRNRVHVLTGVY